jgi:hypothetical protein
MCGQLATQRWVNAAGAWPVTEWLHSQHKPTNRQVAHMCVCIRCCLLQCVGNAGQGRSLQGLASSPVGGLQV